MVSVGRSGCNLPFADKAVFTLTRLIIPFKAVVSPQHDAILVTSVVVRLTSSPVSVAASRVYILIPDKGIGRSVVRHRFPEKTVLFELVTYSGCPKSLSMTAIKVASPTSARSAT